MEWFIAVVAIAALGVAAMAAAGGVGEMDREPVYDTFAPLLPEGPLQADDVRQVRFGVSLRGYAMAQVDDLLERLADEIAQRDARIAELAPPPVAPLAPGAAEPGAAEPGAAGLDQEPADGAAAPRYAGSSELA